MKKIIIPFILILLLFYTVPTQIYSRIGVGVGTGKIIVEDQLKPGSIYELPSITVFNTGDVTSDYGINIALHEAQSELKPESSWFIFSPNKFQLSPGESQEVNIKLNLPIMTEPGNYFAYLEGFPIASSKNENTTVGIAAASKLYFTIIPGNFIEGIYFKISSFWSVYKPWPQRFAILIVITAFILIVKKYLHIEINLKKDKSKIPDKDE